MCSSSRPLTRAGAATSKDSRGFRGGVRADGVAVRGATVALLRVGSTPAGARVLTTATTDAGGMFDLPVPPDLNEHDVLYATALGGFMGSAPLPSPVELATVLGDLRSGPIVINELWPRASPTGLALGLAAATVRLQPWPTVASGSEPYPTF
jgi:hypothetical protein